MKKKASAGKKKASRHAGGLDSSRKSAPSSKKRKTPGKKKAPGKKAPPARLQRTGLFQPEKATGPVQSEVEDSDATPVEKTTGRPGSSRRSKQKPPEKEIQTYEDEYEEEDDYSPREKYMTLGDHLEELRVRILWILGVTTVSAAVAGVFSSRIHEIVVLPYRAITENRDLFLMNVYGPFESAVKLSLLVGFTVAFPFILLILWGFVTPALSRTAAFLGRLVVAFSAILFWGGMAFTWFYVLPASLQFLFVDMMHILPGTAPQVTLERYYNFVFLLELGAGILFQVPILLVLLGGLGIITTEFHKRIWKHVIVGTFILSALFTPPDPISQVLFAVPLMVLYFIAVLIVWFLEWGKRRKERKERQAFEQG